MLPVEFTDCLIHMLLQPKQCPKRPNLDILEERLIDLYDSSTLKGVFCGSIISGLTTMIITCKIERWWVRFLVFKDGTSLGGDDQWLYSKVASDYDTLVDSPSKHVPR
ncbi:hypothetical protein VNO77_03311 [Canavalia gladiata]|uniref:Uncharacterized protein n=1 Tax=Canavalia gladiata TaxID=3824 RepID=A0AAN9R6Q4_CANGL